MIGWGLCCETLGRDSEMSRFCASPFLGKKGGWLLTVFVLRWLRSWLDATKQTTLTPLAGCRVHRKESCPLFTTGKRGADLSRGRVL